MKYGLSDQDLTQMRAAIAQFPEITEVILFGSRAKGNHKPGSDVDLAIKGDHVTHATIYRLADRLNEDYPFPYFFDVIDYNSIDEPNLTEHINRVGITIFAQETSSHP
ncbi:nucleotidyltransferase domain-containing protein [Phormidium yuhuli AB48]|uniref:Nucleotidyltransferase domain-containing protein n=1 Tax=Phormidium yuhuli AB48 TaxID=2940671 RepID=A0ABY5ASN8_9CYAN|nr:nucleotidyltransferase domain-containing protein [Phormidium yuhuli]USR92247.1 nucleotidyltransferase domain-containing protein [Phormidium yuhuli AB48]